MASRLAHNQEIVGSIPAAATLLIINKNNNMKKNEYLVLVLNLNDSGNTSKVLPILEKKLGEGWEIYEKTIVDSSIVYMLRLIK